MNERNVPSPLHQGISIILPALNEEDNLENVINEVIDYFDNRQIPYEIIVVNDGSTDKTREIADTLSTTRKNLSVIHHAENEGYGKSLKDGFRASKYKYLFFTDSDKQFSIENLDIFLPFMKEGKVDMVIGYRIDRKDSPLRKFLAYCFNSMVRVLFSIEYRDIDCAFKLFKKKDFETLAVTSDDFLFNTELLAKAQIKKLEIVQVGVEHYPRYGGKSTVSGKCYPSNLAKTLLSLSRGKRL